MIDRCAIYFCHFKRREKSNEPDQQFIDLNTPDSRLHRNDGVKRASPPAGGRENEGEVSSTSTIVR